MQADALDGKTSGKSSTRKGEPRSRVVNESSRVENQLQDVKDKSQVASRRQSSISRHTDMKQSALHTKRPSKLELNLKEVENSAKSQTKGKVGSRNSLGSERQLKVAFAPVGRPARRVSILDKGERNISIPARAKPSLSKERKDSKANRSQTPEKIRPNLSIPQVSKLRRAQTTELGALESQLPTNIKKGSLVGSVLPIHQAAHQVNMTSEQSHPTTSIENQANSRRSARDIVGSLREMQNLPSIKEREDSGDEQGSPTSPGKTGLERLVPVLRKSPTLELDHLHQHLATTLKNSIDFDDSQKTKNTFVMLLENLTFEMNRAVVYSQLLEKTEEAMRQKHSLLEAVEKAHADCDEKISRLTRQLGEFREDRDKLLAELKVRGGTEAGEALKENRLELKTVKQPKRRNTNLLKEKTQINELVQLFGKRELKFAHQNHAKELIGVLSRGTFTQFKNPMPLKALLKTITTIYTDKIKDSRKLTDTKKQDFDEYVYDYYMQVFGIKEIGEKKFCYFVLSLKYHGQFFRVNLFSRFMGILQGMRYNQEQISKYLEGLEFLESSSKGYPIKNTDTSVRMLYPFVRAEDFTRMVFEKKLTTDEMLEIKKKVDSLKEEDKTGMNTGVLDADVFLEQIIDKYGAILNRTKQYVVEAFDSCDLDGNKTCSVNEWVLLCRYIEPTSFDLNDCIQLFFENANKQIKGESCMTFDKFAAVCTDNSLFSEEKQNKFLGLTEGQSVEDLFSKIRSVWVSKLSQLHDMLDSLTFLADEEIERWKENLEVLNSLFHKKHIASTMKSTTIAYFLTYKELNRLQSQDRSEDNESSDNSDGEVV